MHHPYTPPPFHQASRFTSAPRLYWKLKRASSWISCYFGILGNIAGRISQNIVQQLEYGGQSSVPSLSWRFANILMGFVNLPLCISELPLFAEATIQNKSPGHLSISSVFKWGKGLCTPTLLHWDEILKNWQTLVLILGGFCILQQCFGKILHNAPIFWFWEDFV